MNVNELPELNTHTRRTRLSRFKASQELVQFRGDAVQVVTFDARAFTIRKSDGGKAHVTRNTVYDASPVRVQ